MEKYIIIGILGILTILFLILYLVQRNKKKKISNKYNELLFASRQNLEKYFSDISERAERDFQRQKTNYENQLSLLKIQLEEKQKAINSNLTTYKAGELSKIDSEIQLKKY